MKKIILALGLLVSIALCDGFPQLYVTDKAQIGGALSLGYTLVSPNASTTLNMTGANSNVIIYNGQTVSSYGVVLPAYPDDGMLVCIASVPAVSALVVSPGKSIDTVATATTSLAAGATTKYIYSTQKLTWYKW